MPAVMFCPIHRFFKPFDVTGVDDDMYVYLLGFTALSQSGHHFFTNPTINQSTIDKADAVLKRFNMNISRMALELSYDVEEMVPNAQPFPSYFSKVIKEKVHNAAMTCYSVKMTTPSNPIKFDYLLFSGNLNDTYTEQRHPPGYRIFIGGQDTLGVMMGIRDYVPLQRKRVAHLKLRARRIIRYPGRDGARCKDWTKSDYNHCKIRKGNQIAFEPVCSYHIPASTNFPAVISEHPCNIYKHFSLIYKLADNDTQAQQIADACPRPCEEYSYESVLIAYSDNFWKTSFEVMFDNQVYFVQMREYPLMTFTDLLVDIGGTAGLWYGASVIALFQMAYLLAVQCRAAVRRRRVDQMGRKGAGFGNKKTRSMSF